MKRKEAKRRAVEASRAILELSTETAGSDLALAKQQAALARRIMLKFNVRFDWRLRRFYCRGCKQLIVPGANARVRLSKKMLLITCKDCGRITRKILEQG